MADSEAAGQADEGADLAEKIRECAEALGIAPNELGWHQFQTFASDRWGGAAVNEIQKSLSRLGGYRAVRGRHFPETFAAVVPVGHRLKGNSTLLDESGETS